jgi:glycosyltransferase involved in cell wall biosynthesis
MAGATVTAYGLTSQNEEDASRAIVQEIIQRSADAVIAYVDSIPLFERLASICERPRIIKAEGRKIMEGRPNRIALYRRFGAIFDAVVVTSRSMLNKFVELSLPTDRCELIPTAVDTSYFRPSEDRSAVKTSIGVGVDQHVCLNVARITRHKQAELFAAVAEGVLPRFANSRFVWVGGQNDCSYSVPSALTDGDVEFVGVRGDPRPFYQCADVFLMTSIDESAPNTLLEAMSSGVPVVTTRSYSTISDVIDERSGFVVPDVACATEAVIELLRNVSLRKSVGASARRRAIEEFGLEQRVGRFRALLER